MGLISEHPKKLEIDTLIKSGLSYRELEKAIKERFGLQISYRSIQTYHTKELGGEIDNSSETGDFGGGAVAIPLDMAKVESEVLELTQKYGDSPVKKRVAKLYAIQLQITENALLQHTQGIARYPSEYIKNLQIFSNILMK
jgi:hypothetical protein